MLRCWRNQDQSCYLINSELSNLIIVLDKKQLTPITELSNLTIVLDKKQLTPITVLSNLTIALDKKEFRTIAELSNLTIVLDKKQLTTITELSNLTIVLDKKQLYAFIISTTTMLFRHDLFIAWLKLSLHIILNSLARPGPKLNIYPSLVLV